MSCLPLIHENRPWVDGPGWNCNKDNIKKDCENVKGYSLYGGYTKKNSSRCIGKGTGSDKAKKNNYRAKCFKDNKDFPSDTESLIKCCVGETPQKDCKSTHCPGSSSCGSLLMKKCSRDHKYLFNNEVCNKTTLGGIKDSSGTPTGGERLNSAYVYFCGIGDNTQNHPQCSAFCDDNPELCKDIMIRRCTPSVLGRENDYCRSYIKKFGNQYTDIEKNVEEYCKKNPKNPFCSCSEQAIALEPSYGKYDQIKKAPSCYLKNCIKHGYEFKYQKDWKNQQGGCPPLQICDINIASLDGGNVSNVGCEQEVQSTNDSGELITTTSSENTNPSEPPTLSDEDEEIKKKKDNSWLYIILIIVVVLTIISVVSGVGYVAYKKYNKTEFITR